MKNERLLIKTWAEEEQFDRDRAKFIRGVLNALGIMVMAGFVILMVKGCSSFAVASEWLDLSIIATIESSGHPDAYNRHSGAVGMYQITPICLKDYVQANKTHYNIEDMYNPNISYAVANWYLNIRIPSLLRYYGIEDTIDNRLIAYNWGIGHLFSYIHRKGHGGRIPKQTRDYINKYHGLERG